MKRILQTVLAICAVIVGITMPILGHSACVPKFYNIIVIAKATQASFLQAYWDDAVLEVGDKCVMRPIAAVPGGFQAQIVCMFELNGGQPPPSVGLGAIIDALAEQTDSVHESVGKVQLRIKSHARCPGGGGGFCTTYTCTGGTMKLPNCKVCGP